VRFVVRAQGRAVLLGEGDVVIGRSAYCSLVLDQETLSRVHAALRVHDDGVEIEDLGSSNGTFVNGARISSIVRVMPGDDVRLGHVRVWVEVVNARASADTGRISLTTTEPGDTEGFA
jgi:pSer/pThr/pTyr-binding forkhead associated (FHA) protein